MENASLGARLKAARQNAKLTQNEVARKLGVTYQAISNYERDKCRIEAGILRQLCILYHISPVELLDNPVWNASRRALYAAARTEEERRTLFELYGVPAELEAEYQRLSGVGSETAAPGDGGLNEAEATLVRLFRAVPAESRDMVLDMIEAALKSQGLL